MNFISKLYQKMIKRNLTLLKPCQALGYQFSSINQHLKQIIWPRKFNNLDMVDMGDLYSFRGGSARKRILITDSPLKKSPRIERSPNKDTMSSSWSIVNYNNKSCCTVNLWFMHSFPSTYTYLATLISTCIIIEYTTVQFSISKEKGHHVNMFIHRQRDIWSMDIPGNRWGNCRGHPRMNHGCP